MASVSAQKFAEFYKWLKKQGIWIHPEIEIRPAKVGAEPDGCGSRYSIFAKSAISNDTVILRVPKRSILCLRTSFKPNCANKLIKNGVSGVLGVCLAYMYETSLGDESWCAPYLAVLPEREEQPRFWNETEKNILRGTEVDLGSGLDMVRFFFFFFFIKAE